jgi:hypothetical protein
LPFAICHLPFAIQIRSAKINLRSAHPPAGNRST